jgi:excinuclease ABC subunit B
LDNRPLKFSEVSSRLSQTIYASATPADWELKKARGKVVEQLVRPTGLVDPQVTVRNSEKQIPDLVKEILERKARRQRVLVTTLTKRMAEELASWLKDPANTGQKIRVEYLHADVGTLERSDILADLRKGRFDVVVGVNLLREGLDLPEVSLVVILDADKQGFLRSKTSLIQTMGRAARNKAGKVVLYADRVSRAMQEAISEVGRRRRIQLAFNKKHGITPKSITKPIRKRIVKRSSQGKSKKQPLLSTIEVEALTPGDAKKLLPGLRREMRQAAAALEFEKAARIRDLIGKITS